MEALIAAIVTTFGADALKSWGSFTLILAILGWMHFRQGGKLDAEIKARDAEIERLKVRVDQLQDLRIQDAREMTRVIESATAATTARTQNDALSQELMRRMVENLIPLTTPILPAPGTPTRSP